MGRLVSLFLLATFFAAPSFAKKTKGEKRCQAVYGEFLKFDVLDEEKHEKYSKHCVTVYDRGKYVGSGVARDLVDAAYRDIKLRSRISDFRGFNHLYYHNLNDREKTIYLDEMDLRIGYYLGYY
jgi:hypothetical protein